MGGREGAGGVNLPDLLWRRGEDLGETVQVVCCGGDTVQPWPGGEVPQAEEELEQELVRCRLTETGGVPILNCTFGGDIETMLGAGELLGTGTEIFRDLVLGGNCLLGDLGELAGEEREEQRGRLRRAGLGTGGTAPEQRPPPSSGRGSSIEPPEAELTPDMADTEIRCSSPGGFWTREFCIAA